MILTDCHLQSTLSQQQWDEFLSNLRNLNNGRDSRAHWLRGGTLFLLRAKSTEYNDKTELFVKETAPGLLIRFTMVRFSLPYYLAADDNCELIKASEVKQRIEDKQATPNDFVCADFAGKSEITIAVIQDVHEDYARRQYESSSDCDKVPFETYVQRLYDETTDKLVSHVDSCIGYSVDALFCTGAKLTAAGPTGKHELGRINECWIDHTISKALERHNRHPLDGSVHWQSRVGYSVITQRLTRRMRVAEIERRKNQKINWTESEFNPRKFLTPNPTLMVIFHNNRSRFTVAERRETLKALFSENTTRSERQARVHVNMPSTGFHDVMIPETPMMERAVTDLWNDPDMLEPGDTERDSTLKPRWTDHDLANKDLTLYTIHPFLPVDYDLRTLFGALEWDVQKFFGDVEVDASLWERPLAVQCTTFAEKPLKLRSDQAYQKGYDRQAQRQANFLAGDGYSGRAGQDNWSNMWHHGSASSSQGTSSQSQSNYLPWDQTTASSSWKQWQASNNADGTGTDQDTDPQSKSRRYY